MKPPEFHYPPYMTKLKRGGPAVTHPKDAGLVIAYTGLSRESRVVELGSGSGFMTCQMARIAKEVVTYEKRAEFQEIAKTNVKKAGLENVEFRLRDIFDGIDEQDESFDLVYEDIPEAEKTLDMAYKALKKGGYLVGHCLQSEQAKALHLAAKKMFSDVFTLEGSIREYEAREFGFRPMHFGLTYTAYMVFARK
ncbi:methyltransferase domain-containing protein [Candidatus Micrarchaeota archaeon]|nr:methyltransferase domain-containing protein [Candidatus Micrarchaeota archaeon]